MLAAPPESGRPSDAAAWADGHHLQRAQMRSRQALERRADEDVHLRDGVGAEQLHLRQEVRVDLAAWDTSG